VTDFRVDGRGSIPESCRDLPDARMETVRAVKIHTEVFWVVTLCSGVT